MFPQLKGVKRSVCSRRLPLIPFCQVARGCEGSCQVQRVYRFFVVNQ